MARKTQRVTIPDGPLYARDAGVEYLITEWPAYRAEKWASRGLLALARGRIEIPAGIEHFGWAGVAMVGLQGLAGMDYGEAGPLLDEMMECVQIIPKDGAPRPLMLEFDIEEVATLLLLRQEVFNLHAGFFGTVIRSKLAATKDTPPLT